MGLHGLKTLMRDTHLMRSLRTSRMLSSSSKTNQSPGNIDPSQTNADPHMLGPKRAEELGIPKRPPGTGPGIFMHQRGRLSKFMKSELLPIFPLFAMIGLAFTLAAMTMYREVLVSPTVIVDKKKRSEMVPEMDMPEETAEEGEKYAETSPLKQLARKAPAKQMEPPSLPGDPPNRKPLHQ